jgi:hypothetical protein
VSIEAVCLKHVTQIKKAFGIGGVSANSSSWRNAHAQIDLVIDRSDNCINLCEMKFSVSEFIISKAYKDSLLNKKREFSKELKNRKNIFVTMVTTFGVKSKSNNSDSMDNEVTMDALFDNI